MTRQKALVFLSETEKELSLLRQTVETIGKRLTALAGKREADDFTAYVESLALNLQSFYEGVESVFERVLDFSGEDKPSGPEWHMGMLERMSLPVKKLRPAVISLETAKELDAFRAFRHKVRHMYGFMIVPENVIAIAQKTKGGFEQLNSDLAMFMVFVEELLKE